MVKLIGRVVRISDKGGFHAFEVQSVSEVEGKEVLSGESEWISSNGKPIVKVGDKVELEYWENDKGYKWVNKGTSVTILEKTTEVEVTMVPANGYSHVSKKPVDMNALIEEAAQAYALCLEKTGIIYEKKIGDFNESNYNAVHSLFIHWSNRSRGR